jgi:hypothetical protein
MTSPTIRGDGKRRPRFSPRVLRRIGLVLLLVPVSCSGGAGTVTTLLQPPSIETTSLPGGTVGVAYSQRLSATGGNGTYGWSVSAGALPAGLSLNASSGVITGTPTAAGTSAFTARVTSDGLSDAQPLTITIVAVAQQPTGEPVFNPATGTLVFQDNMDRYTDVAAMGASPQGSSPRISPVPAPVTTSQPVDPSTHQLIAGRNGGKALRMVYSGAYQDGTDFITLNAPATSNSATHHFTYWARISYPGGTRALAQTDRSQTIAIKWFMAWHRVRSNTRIQWQTHDPFPCNQGPNGSNPLKWDTYWGVFDQAGTSCQAYQPVGPYFHEVADSAWHRFTMVFKPHSAAGARDGFAQMWIDGTKVIDISASACGVTPPGGLKQWCAPDDLAALSVADGVAFVRWGGPHTSQAVRRWTYDIDDFTWWVTP